MKAANYTMSERLSAAALALMRYDTLRCVFVYSGCLKDNAADGSDCRSQENTQLSH